MTDTRPADSNSLIQGYEAVATAPIVYFDFVPTYGTLSGAIQVELAASVLRPLSNGGVESKTLETGRLRCSPIAAAHLRDALQKALDMLAQPQDTSPLTAAKVN